MKECPNCHKKYMDYDQYCLVCRYKLKYIEGSNKVEYCPEPHKADYIKMPQQSTKPIVKCPFCNSTNVRKISGMERTVSIVGFGLFSKKINKSFKCNGCGGTF